MGTEESGKTTETAAVVTEATATPAVAPAATETTAAPAKTEAAPAKTEAKPAPVEYTPFKAPEGTKLDDELVTEFTAVAKETGLTQDAAQKLIDKIAPKMAERQSKAMETFLADARKGWIESSKLDKEIGGEKIAENLGVAAGVFKSFGTPELQKLLDTSGLGDHPEMIRWAVRVGKAMGEDKVISGRLSNGAPKDPASVLYDAAPKAA